MDLSKILSIAGKPGLFRVLNQSRGGVVVESLIDGKRFSIGQTQRVSTLSDISVFTWEADMPLADILANLAKLDQDKIEKVDYNDPAALRALFLSVEPNHDTDRVYHSDIKKILKWYQLLKEAGLTGVEEEVLETEEVSVDSDGAGEEE